MKPPYAEYVAHALRTYMSYCRQMELTGCFSPQKPVDLQNIEACRLSLSELSRIDRQCVESIFKSKEPLNISIPKAASKFNINPNHIWNLIGEVQHDIAQRRGFA